MAGFSTLFSTRQTELSLSVAAEAGQAANAIHLCPVKSLEQLQLVAIFPMCQTVQRLAEDVEGKQGLNSL